MAVTTFAWTDTTGDNNWFTSTNWQPSGPPGPGDTATIKLAATVVNITGSTAAVGTLSVQAGTLDLNGNGTLDLGGTLDLAGGALTLNSGGEIAGGTIGGAGIGGLALNRGTLSGVTFEGTLDLSAAGAQVHVTNGITLTGAGGVGAGTVSLTGAGAFLYLDGTETVDNATINVGGSGGGFSFLLHYSGVGTLGPGVTLHQTGSNIGLRDSTTLFNQGTVTADYSGGKLYLQSSGLFVNEGAFGVSNGDRLDARQINFVNAAGALLTVGTNTAAYLGQNGGSSFSNQGSISLASGGSLHLAGSFTQGSIGLGSGFTNTGGTVFIDGVLDNTGNVLATGTAAPIGVPELNFGEILGGTVAGAGSAGPAIIFNRGTLSGVTVEGPLDLSASSASVHVQNGITLTGTGGTGAGTVSLTGANSFVYLDGTESIDNARVDIGNSAGYSFLLHYSGVGTLGPGLSLHQTGLLAAIRDNTTLVNQGSIVADYSGGRMLFQSSGLFVNHGGIAVSNGENFNAAGVNFVNAAGALLTVGTNTSVDLGQNGATSFTNQGSISLASGSSLHLAGSFATGAIGLGAGFTNAGGTVFIDGLLDNTGNVLATGTAAPIGVPELNFGEILGGTVAGVGTANPDLIFRFGTLSGVTFDGLLDLSASNAAVHIQNGITLTGTGGSGPGTVSLTGGSAILYLDGNETFDNATIEIGSGTDSFLLHYSGSGTLGPGLTLHHTALRAAVRDNTTLVNQGSIIADYAGGHFYLQNNGSFLNTGGIAVSNGDMFDARAVNFFNTAGGVLSIGPNSNAYLGSGSGSFSNQGSISLASGGSLHLGGTFTTGSIGLGAGFVNSSGTVFIEGVLDNTGSVLATGTAAPIGVPVLNARGEILGGTVAGVGTAGADLVFKNGSLSGVTFEGPLDLSATSAMVHVVNGITLTGANGSGPGTVSLTGNGALLYMDGSETFDNATIDIGNSAGASILMNYGGAGTLGPGLLLHHTGARAQIRENGTLVNRGTIIADYNNGALTIYTSSATLINDGTIAVSNGDTLTSGVTFTNNGTVAALDGGHFTFANGTTVTNLSGGTLSGGTWQAVDGGRGASMVVLGTGSGIVVDNAAITLSGTNATFSANGATIEATLTSIAAAGTLQLLAGHNFLDPNPVVDSGVVLLGNAAFNPSGGGTVAAGGTLAGYGTFGFADANFGLVEGTGGKLVVTGNTFTNSGTVAATVNSYVAFTGVTVANNAGGVLAGGAWEAFAGATIALTGGAVVTDAASVTLSGAGSELTAGGIAIDASLATIAGAGSLALLAGRGLTDPNALVDAGQLRLGGGVLDVTAAGLVMQTGGLLIGAGTVDGAISGGGLPPAQVPVGGGLIEASGGTLDLTGSVSSGPGLAIDPATVSDLKIDGVATAAGAIGISNGNQTLEIGAAGNLTIAIAETAAGGTIRLDGGSLSDPAGISLSGALIEGFGTVAAAISGDGASTVYGIGGTLDLLGSVASGPVLAVGTASPSDLKIDGIGTAASAVSLVNPNQSLEVGAAGALTVAVAESAAAGAIRLDGGSLADAAGITIASGATLVGTGTASGPVGGAGLIAAAGGILDLTGAVQGDAAGLDIANAAGNVLELDNTVAAGATITFSGPVGRLLLTDFTGEVLTGFGGTVAGLTVGGSGTVPTNAIDLRGVTTANVTAATISGSTLSVIEGATTVASIGLSSAPAPGTSVDWIGDGASGTDFFLSTVVCFAAGTRIRCEGGEVAVETLRIGDRVVTLGGAARPIKWIGRRAYGGRFLAGNRNLLPIRIAAGALADGVPCRDLLVSPKHALFLGGMLLPAGDLVNGVSIVQERTVETIAYYHIELDSHDILYAEGAATESYVDCDNRSLFHNAGEFARLYPGEDRERWRFCAPRVEEGPDLAAVRTRLARRARRLQSAASPAAPIVVLPAA